jgi:hypothetical protein
MSNSEKKKNKDKKAGILKELLNFIKKILRNWEGHPGSLPIFASICLLVFKIIIPLAVLTVIVLGICKVIMK